MRGQVGMRGRDKVQHTAEGLKSQLNYLIIM